jgi:hypothetical protein
VNLKELDVHSLPRVIQARLAYEAMQQLQIMRIHRPIVLATGYFAGMNRFATKMIEIKN